MDTEKLRKQADWSLVEKRPTWGCVSSMELSKILNVPFTSIGNWALRGLLIEPEPRRKGQGNKNLYKISKIRAWLESRPENEIHWEFIINHMDEQFKSIESAITCADRHWRVFKVERVKSF